MLPPYTSPSKHTITACEPSDDEATLKGVQQGYVKALSLQLRLRFGVA
jgi:hypothetical protein